MSRIVSSLPGRIRVRDRVLRNWARLDQLEVALRRIEGVTSLQSNPGVALYFDVARADTAVLEDAVDAAVDAALVAPLPKSKRSLKMQVNRYAKVGMLGGLATSLALAATGQKKLHAVTGGLFIACLGVHLGVHHRSLLR